MASRQDRETARRQLVNGEVREKLAAMESNSLLNTTASTYTARSAQYPDGKMPFVDKHIAYLLSHPKLDPDQYLSNLRLMLKTRR